jgi:hypothetical protein
MVAASPLSVVRSRLMTKSMDVGGAVVGGAIQYKGVADAFSKYAPPNIRHSSCKFTKSASSVRGGFGGVSLSAVSR